METIRVLTEAIREQPWLIFVVIGVAGLTLFGLYIGISEALDSWRRRRRVSTGETFGRTTASAFSSVPTPKRPTHIPEPSQAQRSNAAPPAPASRGHTAWNAERLFAEINAGNTVATITAAIKAGVPINSRDTDGATPLHYAARLNLQSSLDDLIYRRADVNAQLKSGATALSIAAAKGHRYIVQQLLKADADTTLDAPLAGAAYNGQVDTVRVLLDHGLPVDQSDNSGWTPLHIAASKGHADLVDLLLERGADLWAKTPEGFTPKDCAILGEHDKALERILAWEVKRPAPPGWTPTVPEPDRAPASASPARSFASPEAVMAESERIWKTGTRDQLTDFEYNFCAPLVHQDPARTFDDVARHIAEALASVRSIQCPRADRNEQWQRSLASVERELHAIIASHDMQKLIALEDTCRRKGYEYFRLPPRAVALTERCRQAIAAHAVDAHPSPCLGLLIERLSHDMSLRTGVYEVLRLAATDVRTFAQSLSAAPITGEEGPRRWRAVAVYQSRQRPSADVTADDLQTVMSMPEEDDGRPPVDPMYPALPLIIIAVDGGAVCDMKAYAWDWDNLFREGYGSRGRYVRVDLKVVG